MTSTATAKVDGAPVGAATALAAEERRQELRRLGEVDRRLIAYNAGYLATTWAIIAAAVVLAARRRRWWALAIAGLVVSSRQQALLNVEHECIHGIFVKGKARNTFIGRWLCASPCGSPYHAAKTTHLRHHRLLARPDDPDRDLHAGDDKATRRGVASYFGKSLLGGYAARAVLKRRPAGDGTGPAGAPPAQGDLVPLAATQAALWAVSGLTLGWWVYPILWAGPLATVTAFSHLLRSFGEHALTPAEEATHGNRLISTTSNPVELALVAPYNMNWHAEHHLHPFVPAPRLPQVRPLLPTGPGDAPLLVRRSYARTLVDYFHALP